MAPDSNPQRKDLLFKAVCPGCQVKIKIRDARLVGTKVTCPSCQTSFVLQMPKQANSPSSAGPAKPTPSKSIPAKAVPAPPAANRPAPPRPAAIKTPTAPVGRGMPAAGSMSLPASALPPLQRAPLAKPKQNSWLLPAVIAGACLVVIGTSAVIYFALPKGSSRVASFPAASPAAAPGMAVNNAASAPAGTAPTNAVAAPANPPAPANSAPTAPGNPAMPMGMPGQPMAMPGQPMGPPMGFAGRPPGMPPFGQPVYGPPGAQPGFPPGGMPQQRGAVAPNPQTVQAGPPAQAPAAPATAQPTTAQSAAAAAGTGGTTRQIIDRVGPGILLITTYDAANNKLALGSGFVIDPSGRVATNFHVIESASRAVAQFKDGTDAKITGYWIADKPHDLAILQLERASAGMTVLPLARGGDPQQGDDVIAIGHPKGFNFTVSTGIVSAVRKPEDLPDGFQDLLEAPDDSVWIQTTAPISPGNSGGPLLNSEGEVIGVNTWVSLSGENLAFATHVRLLEGVIDQLPGTLSPLPVPGSKPVSDAQVAAIVQKFISEYREYMAELDKAGLVAKNRLADKNPTPRYMSELFQLASKNRRQPLALDSLLAVCDIAMLDKQQKGKGTLERTTNRLLEDHGKDEKLAEAAILVLRSQPSEETNEFFTKLTKRSPHREVKAIATFCLMLHMAMLAPEDPEVQQRAVGMMSEIEQKYADVKIGETTLGEIVKLMRAEMAKSQSGDSSSIASAAPGGGSRRSIGPGGRSSRLHGPRIPRGIPGGGPRFGPRSRFGSPTDNS